MARFLLVALVAATLLVPVTVDAKGPTALIVLTAPTLAVPLTTTAAEVQQFDVWSGPGVNGVAVSQADGFIAHWRSGSVDAPARESARYDVLFYTNSCAVGDPSCGNPLLTYVVTYAVDAATRQGYVYFPAQNETLYAVNGSSIARGRDVDGRWFRATAEWDRFAAPLIGRAAQASSRTAPAN